MAVSVEGLASAVRGRGVEAGAPDYDECRALYNAMIDKRPAVVVRAVNAGDVMAAVSFARENGLPVAIRGGGHSVPGFGTWDDAVVVSADLHRLTRSELEALRAVHFAAPQSSVWETHISDPLPIFRKTQLNRGYP